VAGGVEHDPDALRVAIWRLPWCFCAAGLDRVGDGRFKVDDFDLEVEHLGLLSGPLGPRRRLIPRLALDV
jgi:hypothetical protein